MTHLISWWAPEGRLLYVVAMLGTGVLFSYYYLLPRTLPSRNIDELWFGIHGPMRNLFYVSILLSIIAFLGGFHWMYKAVQKQDPGQTYDIGSVYKQAVKPYVLLLTSALWWSVTLWIWGQVRHTNWDVYAKWSVFSALCYTTLGATWVWLVAWRQHAPTWVLLFLGYFVVHVLVFDNIGWFRAFYLANQ